MQDRATAKQNVRFFAGNKAYADRVQKLDTYRIIRAALEEELRGANRVLDIGNGGVFDYEPGLAGHITVVDLFLNEATPWPPNVTALRGDALALPVPDESYDTVLMVMLLHHLVGSRAPDLGHNVESALLEARRALTPGGRLIVIESCVPYWFFRLEQAAFRPLAAVARTPFLNHPATIQLPARSLLELMRGVFGVPRTARRLSVGRWVLQFGHPWPIALTPARPWLFVAQKPPRLGQVEDKAS